ncbi:MFS transporter, partial [Dickeya dianthicola]|nr:MFS transporter [Dickeya dianthicola]
LWAPSRLPDTRGEKPVALDMPGTVLLSLMLASLLFPLALGPIWHWPWFCVAALLSSLVWFALLWRVERRQSAP